MTENERMKHPDTESAAAPGTEQMRPTQLTRVDTSSMEQNIRDINDAAAKQHQMSIDNAMRQEADAMKLAEREAAAQYAEQRRQTDLAERQALDNSALYAEARGDRGGVGQAQYNAIQATSAKNRADIQQAQTKMASDVTRQIAQMRRQGEYKKADALLSLSQQYLSQLNDLKRWETESNMTVDQANNALAQWQMNFEQAAKQADLEKALAEAGLTGVYNGQQTLAAQQFAADQAYRDKQLAMAQQEFDLNKALSEAGLTGVYNGQQTLEAQKMAADQAYRDQQAALEKALAEAGLTGMYNGQQTLEAQKMAADQAYRDQQAALEKALAEAGLTGMYNGQQTLDAQKQAADLAYREQQAALEKALAEAGLTGMYNGQQTLDAQKQAADQAYRDQQMALAQQEFAYNQNRDAVADAQNAAKTNASLGWSALEGGMMPSADQLSAMGLTTAQAQQYINDARAIAEATAAAQKIGDNSKVAALGWTALEAGIVPSAEQLAAMGVSAADAQAYINRNRPSGTVIGGSTGTQQSGDIIDTFVGATPGTPNPGTPTNNQSKVDQVYQNALNQYRANGSLPSLSSLVNRGLTTAEAQSVLDRLKAPTAATQTSTPNLNGNGNLTPTVNNVHADQMLSDTQSNKPISPSTPSTPSTQTSNQSKVDQVYQNALNQYRANGSLPSLSSLVNRGLTNAEAQSVLDRLKPPTATQTTQQRNSMGVTDLATGVFITPTSPSVVSIRTDSNGNTVYTLKDGRILTDYTSMDSTSTPSTAPKGSPSTAPKGSQTAAVGGGSSGASTTVSNADSTLGTLARLLGKIF